MGCVAEMDFISDLPQSIIESILTRLPIRDAVRTSILSSKWRYRWATITDLVFDENCVAFSKDRLLFESRLFKFISRVLFLHQGPIHKFQVSTECYPHIDQWILFLSMNDIRELVLNLGDGNMYAVPSCLYNCRKLTHLELYHFDFDPPMAFKGFPCLKSLNLHHFWVPESMESLISSCPLLENLSLSFFDSLDINICAPNLKFLHLEGEFRDICLENTPLLVSMSVVVEIPDGIAEHSEQSSSCYFIKLLGGVPLIEKLVGSFYFTKYLSIGKDPGQLPITYIRLHTIELYAVNFNNEEEIMVVIRLITNSPNLRELKISGKFDTYIEAYDLSFWDHKCPSDCSFKQLKLVKMDRVPGVTHDMELIKYLLKNSPVLEIMSINPWPFESFDIGRKLTMAIELLRFQRASARAEIVFVDE